MTVDFKPSWNGIDPLGDRLAFEVGRCPRHPRKWLLWRVSIGCFETGRFDTADLAKAWGTRLTHRRPVKWEKA